jgi:hypothetical protein
VNFAHSLYPESSDGVANTPKFPVSVTKTGEQIKNPRLVGPFLSWQLSALDPFTCITRGDLALPVQMLKSSRSKHGPESV